MNKESGEFPNIYVMGDTGKERKTLTERIKEIIADNVIDAPEIVIADGGNDMADRLPFIEDADLRIRSICLEGIYAKYEGELKDKAIERLDEELAIVKRIGFASAYLTLYETLKAVNAKQEDFYLRFTLASSIVSYTLGLTQTEPVNCSPRLYPEFLYGIRGDRRPFFELDVTPELREKLKDYFENVYPGKEPVTIKFDEKEGIERIYIGDLDEAERIGDYYSGGFNIGLKSADDTSAESLIDRKIMEACSPKTFEEYVKCFGLTKSRGAWEDNAEILINNKDIPFQELISSREDVYEYMMEHGIDKQKAYEITEYVRKGRAEKPGWKDGMVETMKDAGIPEWYIESCSKIKYLYTRAHAVECVGRSKL